jgi:hypothetical protein
MDGFWSKQRMESCGYLPFGFARLRYFFGKHLAVADFIDEQRYHAGKMRFHNQRLHGSGILCGLHLHRASHDSTVIRVRRGAALDRCGREIIVGADQCIDVGAWYQREREKREEEKPGGGWPGKHEVKPNKLRLCVVLRYDECPTHPESAPRDPCSCSDDGYEFGRVSEEFQLKLVLRGELDHYVSTELFPSRQHIATALARSAAGTDLLHSLALPITEGCPPPTEELWIVLGCFTAVLSPDYASVTRIEDISTSRATVLLSTEVIQHLLANLYADFDADLGGPKIIEVRWKKLPDYKYLKYQMILVLSGPVVRKTIEESSSFNFRRLSRNGGWAEAPSGAVTSEYFDKCPTEDNIDSPAIYVTIDDTPDKGDDYFLKAGRRYQLYINPALPHPIADWQLRPLRPRQFAWRFALKKDPDKDDLEMVPPPFGDHT